VLRLVVVWLHVVAAATWVGGTLYASHLVVPAVVRGGPATLSILTRGRVVAWAALALLVATGLENLRHLAVVGPWLVAKLVVVLALLATAAHRDFGALPGAIRAIERGTDPVAALAGVRWLDRVSLMLALVALFLAVGIARGR
jgi:uncharacterized membrane protein